MKNILLAISIPAVIIAMLLQIPSAKESPGMDVITAKAIATVIAIDSLDRKVDSDLALADAATNISLGHYYATRAMDNDRKSNQLTDTLTKILTQIKRYSNGTVH